MKTPLNDIINKNINHISFHTPSHNGVSFCKEENYLKEDITELSYSDNLLNPFSVLYECQKEIASVYGAQNSMLITSGATTAIHIIINALKSQTFLIAGPCHKSVYSALRINKVRAFFVKDLNSLNDNIEKTKATALFITSPDYFGKVADYTLSKDIILVVDESHGSHFVFSKSLPKSEIKNADLVVHSMHKTLNCLSGSALIHYKDRFIDVLKNSLNEIHSTSPSYLMMARMERTVKEFHDKGREYYEKVFEALISFEFKLNKPFNVIATDDKTRLRVSSPFNSLKVAKYLEENNIFCELTYKNEVVFIVTPFNYQHLDYLVSLLNKYEGKSEEFTADEESFISNEPQKAIYYDDYELIKAEKSIGRILYKEIGLYPPGVPIAYGGQIITEEMSEFICNNNKRMFGLDNNRVYVVK